MESLAEKNIPLEKKKEKKGRLHQTAAVGAQRQTAARILGKFTFPKYLQVSTSSFVWGKKQPVSALRAEHNSPAEFGFGGVCEAHLCQRFKERAKRRIGVILADSLPVEVAGFAPLVARWKWKSLRCQERSSMSDQCVTARQQKHQQETWIRATGPVWRTKIILHVRFNAHALTGVKASHINSIDGEFWR